MGTHQVKLSNGRPQIALTYGGKRKYLSLGLSDSRHNRDYTDMVRSWIQNDLRCNSLDPSLDRYRRETNLILTKFIYYLIIIFMSQTDSRLEWFIGKFYRTFSTTKADRNGFIIASEFRRFGDKAITNGQYRQLMKLAVDRDYATDNGIAPNQCKYAIRFNSSLVNVRLFDKDLFVVDLFGNLPPGEIFATSTDIEKWKIHKDYWLSVIESLIIYENTGEFKTNFSPRDERLFIFGIKKWVYVYEILKYGWKEIKLYENLKYEKSEIELAHTLKHQSHNDCFKYILMCVCKSHWNNRHVNLVNRPYTQRKVLDDINNKGISGGGIEKLIEKLLVGINWERNKIADHCASLNWLIEAAKQIQNGEVKRALEELLETLEEIKATSYTIVNRCPKRQKL